MEDQSQIFTDEEFGSVHVLGDIEDPLFCLADVCHILDIGVGNVVQRLKKGLCSNEDLNAKGDPKRNVLSKHPVKTAGGIQMMYFVNEDGFYDVILSSRKPIAIRFRKWVTSVVLPALRKTGKYSIVTPDNPAPVAPAASAVDLAAIQAQISSLNETVAKLAERIKTAPAATPDSSHLQTQIDELKTSFETLTYAFEEWLEHMTSRRLTNSERGEKLLQIADKLIDLSESQPIEREFLIKAGFFFVGKKFV